MNISTNHIADRWNRGSLLNQRVLQVPGQTFSAGDPHPLAKNVVYQRTCNRRKKPQVWTTATGLKNANKKRCVKRPSKRKTPSDFSKIDKKYRHKDGAHKGMLVQTLLQMPNKKFKKGDPHPFVKNVIFLRFNRALRSPQIWGSLEQSDSMKKVKLDAYYGPNREKLLAQKQLWKIKNLDKVREANKKTCERRFKEGYNRQPMQHVRDWRMYRGPEWVRKQAREYSRKRRAQFPEINIVNSQRARLHEILGPARTNRTTQYLGCSGEKLIKHLLSQRYPRKKTGELMTIENRGFYGWHVDHIKPVSSFDHKDPEQVAECWHYTNLQPLWAEDNLEKSDKLDWEKHYEI